MTPPERIQDHEPNFLDFRTKLERDFDKLGHSDTQVHQKRDIVDSYEPDLVRRIEEFERIERKYLGGQLPPKFTQGLMQFSNP